jgi:hypothetical protein
MRMIVWRWRDWRLAFSKTPTVGVSIHFRKDLQKGVIVRPSRINGEVSTLCFSHHGMRQKEKTLIESRLHNLEVSGSALPEMRADCTVTK